MALNLSIDLSNASFGDLVALVDAARSAGMDPHDQVDFDGTTLSLSVDVDAFLPGFAGKGENAGGELVDADGLDDAEVIEGDDYPAPGGEPGDRPRRDWSDRDHGHERYDRPPYPRNPLEFVDTSAIGDAAIRSVIDILTGRQDPPRGR